MSRPEEQVHLINSGWYTIEVHWSNRYGEKRKAPLLGLGDEMLFYPEDGRKEEYYNIQVTGPGGTSWDIDIRQPGRYKWTGPIWDQQMNREDL